MILLFGAGASKPAQIPDMPEMTRRFLENPLRLADLNLRNQKYEEVNDDVKSLDEVSRSYYGKSDLEFLISLLLQLENDNFRDVIEHKYPRVRTVGQENLKFIRILINDYIRKECEKIDLASMEYLWPLTGLLPSDKQLSIYSLNYDGLVEAFCESNSISYSDGFTPYWDPEHFSGKRVNIFKLHGSLYWFKTESGKIFKVPIKGLDLSKIKHLTDESLSEIMIYPALQKNKQSQVYLWLHNKFLDDLKTTDTCVVIGYSFRDEDIRNAVIDSLKINTKLWLMVVSPNASSNKKEYFKEQDLEIRSRVFCVDKTVQDVITDRKVTDYLVSLEQVRENEDSMWRTHATQSITNRGMVENVLNKYASIGQIDSVPHEDRVLWIHHKMGQRGISYG
jgi:hypothetical protein